MEAEELLEQVRHRSFEPFRMHVSDGMSYDVRHPEQIVVGRRSSHVGIGAGADQPYQRVAIVANVHITRVEPLNGE